MINLLLSVVDNDAKNDDDGGNNANAVKSSVGGGEREGLTVGGGKRGADCWGNCLNQQLSSHVEDDDNDGKAESAMRHHNDRQRKTRCPAQSTTTNTSNTMHVPLPPRSYDASNRNSIDGISPHSPGSLEILSVMDRQLLDNDRVTIVIIFIYCEVLST